MKRKLIITSFDNKILTTNIENGEVVEIHVSDDSEISTYRLGSIYIGKVKKIVPSIHAAFIEIGKGMECYYDMNERGGTPIRSGDEFMVQISKEAVKTKQPAVTRNISLTGKYCVLTAGDSRIGISNKICAEKSDELKKAMQPYKTREYGFIVRTNAKNCEVKELINEAVRLRKEYEHLTSIAGSRVCLSCLKKSPAPYISDLRNIYQDGLDEIIVEDKYLYGQIKEYLESEQPEDAKKLRLYEDKLLPLHKLYSIETKLSDALREKVWMKSGAYLVIQPTEALTVIDVNTGKYIGKKRDDAAYFKINLEAAKEAAKQIRLRNLSGIILVDFINLDSKDNINRLLEAFKGYLASDPIQTLLIDITKLQLVEVTRKKVRKPLHEMLHTKKGEC